MVVSAFININAVDVFSSARDNSDGVTGAAAACSGGHVVSAVFSMEGITAAWAASSITAFSGCVAGAGSFTCISGGVTAG